MIEKKLIDYVNDHSLSGNEFFICYLIYLSKVDKIDDKFNKYIENNKDKDDYLAVINSLEKNKFIKNLNKKGEFELDKIQVTDKFTDKLFIDADKAFEEVKAIYPKRIQWEDKGQTKVFPTFKNDVTDSLLYQNFTGNRKDKHHEFLCTMENHLLRNKGKATYKFETFIENYDGIRIMYEDMVNDNLAPEFDIS